MRALRRFAPLVRGDEVERRGVDAIALAGRSGSVVEDVPQVPAAGAAEDLGAAHEQAVVGVQLDGFGDRRLGEAGPAGAGVELGVGREQLRTTGRTAVDAVGVAVEVLTAECRLCTGLTQDALLRRSEPAAPLVVR